MIVQKILMIANIIEENPFPTITPLMYLNGRSPAKPKTLFCDQVLKITVKFNFIY